MRNYATLVLLAAVGSAYATTLTPKLNADDYATAFLSTSDSASGSAFLVKEDTTWQSGPVTASVTLIVGQTNYLHVRARDAFGAPSMLIAQANLGDAGFAFLNGSQQALTNATQWQASLTGFGTGYFAPYVIGNNGDGPWGTTGGSGIDANAKLIWTTPLGSQPGADTGYYSIAIRPVPEPSTFATLGLGGLAFLRRRRG